MKKILLFSFIVFCGLPANAREALSKRVVRYDIRVSLDTGSKTLTGTTALEWTNPSADTVSELHFHLYMNAFRNTRSTFMEESGGQTRGIRSGKDTPEDWGWIDIRRMLIEGETDITSSIRFYQPDDGNQNDRTVVRVMLPGPVMPGEKIRIDMDFTTKLPRIFARTGFSHDFFLVGQWFPKIGVYEPAGTRGAEKGRWNCHQFHANSEFYADFGVYRVSMTLPAGYRVGATGECIDSLVNADSTQTLTWLAEDVVDFVWTASPLFRELKGNWNRTSVRILYPPGHEDLAPRYMQALLSAMDYFSRALGPYPYPSITVVDPPFHAMGAWGMEYPMFITTGTLAGMPVGLRLPELVTIHEFGHNYLMGILATNEAEEAWMDEGMTSYYEARILDHVYGEGAGVFEGAGIRAGDREMLRLGYASVSNPRLAPSTRFSWEYRHGGYGIFSYQKPALMLFTLEGLVGTPTMNEIMQTYYRKWKFRHPGTEDFIRVVNEVVEKNHGSRFGDDMNWFFDQLLYGTGVCDYSLAFIGTKAIQPPRGIDEVAGNKVAYENIRYSEKIYESRVIIHRLGEVSLPVEVRIDFDDGSSVMEYWDGKAESHEFTYRQPGKVISAVVDPDGKLPIDTNRMNNSYTSKPGRTALKKWAVQFLFFLQNIFQFTSLVIA